MTEILFALAIGFVLVQDHFARKERKDLVDRLMAKDLPELKRTEAMAEEAKRVNKTPQPDLIPLSEASDEQFLTGIRKDLGRETPVEVLKRRLRRKNG